MKHFLLHATVATTFLVGAAASAQYEPRYEPTYYSPGEYTPGPDIESQFDQEFAMGVGYAKVEFSSDDGTLDDADAIHFDPVLSFAPVRALPPLRVGAAVGISFTLEDVGGVISSGGGGGFIFITGDTGLMLFEPELRLSWRQALGPEEAGFFVEPGIAGGGTFALLDFDDEEVFEAGGPEDPDEWASTFHARAFLRAGMRVSGGVAGLEAGYMRGGELDFGATSGEIQEFYIGIFGALKF